MRIAAYPLGAERRPRRRPESGVRMRKLGKWKCFRKTVIAAQDPRGPLLIRYILFRCEAWGLYLHHLLRSDDDRALHDHPWPFVSIVLRGGYFEIHDQTVSGRKIEAWRKPGSVLLRPAEWRHRVVLREPAWTLVIVGRRCRRWGFFAHRGWFWWRNYNPELGICEERVLFTDGED